MTKTILLIEGDEELRRRFRKFLEFDGFRVIALPTESAAQEFLGDQPTDVDLVIAGTCRQGDSDIELLLDQMPNTKVLLTAIGEGCTGLTPYPYLLKPVPPERLVAKAHQLLRSRKNGS